MNIEKIIVLVIWAMFISQGITGGFSFVSEFQNDGALANELLGEFPLQFKVVVLVVVFVSALLSLGFARTKNKTFIEKKFVEVVDKILTPGASSRIAKSLRFELLALIFFMLIGGIGLIRSFIYNYSGDSIFICLLIISFGLGSSAGLFISKKRIHS